MALAQRHDVLAQVVDEGDAGVKNKARPQGSCASRQGRLRVENGNRARGDERGSALTVQVRDVNDGDFAAF